MSRTRLALDVVQDLRSLADSIETLAQAITEGVPEPADKGNAPPVVPLAQTEKPLSLAELRAFVAECSSPENRPKIKALLAQHGVNKLTELPEDQYAILWREVEAL